MKNPFARKPKNDYESYDDNYDSDFYRGEEDEEDGVLDDLENESAAAPVRRPTQSAATGNMLKVVKPRSCNEGPTITRYLVDGYTVVMNIEEMERADTMRLIDFLLGALEVLGGECKRVTKTTLVLSPRRGEVIDDESGYSSEE